MKKETKKEIILWILGIFIIIAAISIPISISYNDRLDDETVVVEGKIISVEVVDEENKYINEKVLLITFDTGEAYKIVTWEEYIDFTANSKFIVQLFWDGDDDYWEIKRMYKVPSED